MTPSNPEHEAFRAKIEGLRDHPLLSGLVEADSISLSKLTTEQVNDLIKDEPAYYFLIAAADLNRTAIKRGMATPEAKLVVQSRRRAHVIREKQPMLASFRSVADTAITLRDRDLQRKRAGGTEALFRERLVAEQIPIFMSPPVRRVPGVLIAQRKPDGVYPDPTTGLPPKLYLEVKRVRRVSDDIQKRLYEIAEVSLEMKALYGKLHLKGVNLSRTLDVAGNEEIRAMFREQILGSLPVVVALLICSRDEAGRYRSGAEAFIDRVFFQEEINECVDFLRNTVNEHEVK